MYYDRGSFSPNQLTSKIILLIAALYLLHLEHAYLTCQLILVLFLF